MSTSEGRDLLGSVECGVADPMVGCWNSKNSFLTNLSTDELFPTAVSPNSTNLKFTVFAITQREGGEGQRKKEGKERKGRKGDDHSTMAGRGRSTEVGGG